MTNPRKIKYEFYANDIREAATDAALQSGLTGLAEYLRIALAFIVETGRLPAEFEGRRSIHKVGRPRER